MNKYLKYFRRHALMEHQDKADFIIHCEENTGLGAHGQTRET